MTTYCLDTNYFLRLLLRDEETQFQIVYKLFSSAQDGQVELITSVVVFFELYWVLSSFYKRDKAQLIPILEKVLSLPGVTFESHAILRDTLMLFSASSVSLEDCYHLVYAQRNGATLLTFDKKLGKLAKKK